ncbi:hypothetical protein RND81_14G031800 [Saponaria officinalis]|uniref:GRF-type domain-containing protein n=1 Tax=Saponaria officinalis TaxID=3572 RepID=A0AAW1GKV8_SAPOF
MHSQILKCNCGFPVAFQTSWTFQNPGRRFVACKFYHADTGMRGCTYFKWLDEDMTEWQRQLINQLSSENTCLRRELKQQKQELETFAAVKVDVERVESKVKELMLQVKSLKKEKKQARLLLGIALIVIFVLYVTSLDHKIQMVIKLIVVTLQALITKCKWSLS